MKNEDLLRKFTKEYLNKLEVGYKLSRDIKLEDFWEDLLSYRKKNSEILPFKDQQNNNFWYVTTNLLQKKLHEIDSYGRDTLYAMVKKDIEEALIKESIIEEGFYSSVIEGAFSTLKKAKELADKKASPKNNSEQMILNNFYAMRFILENKEKDISNDLILELHKIVSQKTLDDHTFEGKYRDDQVYITNSQGEAIYIPPPAKEIPEAMEKLINYINKQDEFVHPVIKASILHFYFVYLHPFFDGNGRTSRALFYFYLLKHNYGFFKYFSISSIINATRGRYYKSIKEVEDYGSDMTYFLIYMANSIIKAISDIKTKISEHYKKDYYISKIKEQNIILNDRQQKFINKFLFWKEKQISIEKYISIYNIVYQTARTDLLDFTKKGIFKKEKKGKKFIFMLNPEF